MNRINEAALLEAIEENLTVAEAAAWSEVQDLLERVSQEVA